MVRLLFCFSAKISENILPFFPQSVSIVIDFVGFYLQAPKKDKAPPPSSKPAKSGGGKQKKKVRLSSKFQFFLI